MTKRSVLYITLLAMAICAQSSSLYAQQYEYDKEQRLKRVVYTGGREINYSYDAAGNLVSEVVTAPDVKGTVQIRVVPTVASWTVVDSTGVSHAGTGNQDLTGIPIGRIDVFWHPLTKGMVPAVNPVVNTLAVGTPLLIQGIYSVLPTAVDTWWMME